MPSLGFSWPRPAVLPGEIWGRVRSPQNRGHLFCSCSLRSRLRPPQMGAPRDALNTGRDVLVRTASPSLALRAGELMPPVEQTDRGN